VLVAGVLSRQIPSSDPGSHRNDVPSKCVNVLAPTAAPEEGEQPRCFALPNPEAILAERVELPMVVRAVVLRGAD
jgi:hypothetical protein